MKIAMDAQTVADQNQRTGLGVYVDSLLREYARSAPKDVDFYLMHTRPQWNGADYGPNFHPVSYRFGRFHSLAILFRLNRVLKEIGADVFHAACTNGIPPHCCCPSVVTVHDLFPLTIPGTPFVQKCFFRLLFAITVKNAGYFICNSRSTQSEQCRFCVPEEKTEVIYLAPQSHYVPSMRCQPDHPFFLCVGAQEPRKGQVLLAEAYRKACVTLPELPDLYFIGPDRGDGEKMRAQIRLCPKLHWQDYVSQKELAVKYLSASLFVFPSLAEGFGLPLLEAMQAGTPVLCSDIPVFHEVGGNVVTYVQPTPEAFCQALLTADHLKTPSPEVLYARSQEFTWEKTAAQTMNVLLQAGSANQ